MSVTADEFKATEEILTRYFRDIRKLNIWKASANSRKEHKKRLEARIQSGLLVHFSDSVKSPQLSLASPSNRQPPKGLDACIDKAAEVYDNLLAEKDIVELDIIVTEEEIEKLERDTLLISEIMKALSKETIRVLELKLNENKSFEDIGEAVKKSKSAAHEFYKKTVNDICKWLKYMDAFSIEKK